MEEPSTVPRRGDSAKRVLDVVVAAIALIALSPLLVIVALWILSASGSPVLFRQERLGRDEVPFVMLKFRTMTTGNDDTVHRDYVTRLLTEEQPPDGGQAGLYKLANDPRVTAPGRFLRKTSLDELPQLFNVLRGEMSLVGPRPVLDWEASHFTAQQRKRFSVKPGVTGLWQVSGRSALTMQEALELDVLYAETRSFGLDLKILVRTVPVLMGRSHAR